MAARTRLGWLGPVIVIVGAAVAALGVWYMVHARPEPGDVVDRVPIDGQRALIVRSERRSDRAFVELHDGDQLLWQAMVPRYQGGPGRPGIAWGGSAVSVRVIRNGRAELFALALHDAAKLGGMQLAPNHGPIVDDPASPVTLTDHIRSYEVVSGADWHQLVAIDLTSGKALWRRELGQLPVRAGGAADGVVWIDQAVNGEPGQRPRRCFAGADGADVTGAQCSVAR
jgi:hypothetical protein